MFLPPVVDSFTANPVNRGKRLFECPVKSEQPDWRIVAPDGVAEGRAMLSQVVVPAPVVRQIDTSPVDYSLVSDDDIMFLQQRLNVLDELRSTLLGLDIVALSMPEAKEVF